MIAALALTALVAGGLCAAEMENPYKKAKVGDWVTYTTTTSMPALNVNQTNTIKQTVKAKDEKEVTILIENEVAGAKMAQETKVALDKPYDPTRAGAKQGTDIQKVGEGKETITVGGKKYACTWYQVKMTMKQATGDISGVTKSWVCTDVPLGGLVKSESDMEVNMGGKALKTHVTMVLKDTGKGP